MQTIAHTMLSGATGTGAGISGNLPQGPVTFQATVVGSGAVSATVIIQVSNDNTNWLTLGTITISGTTSATDGFAANAAWVFVRANVNAISGTSAAITAIMGA